MAEANNISLEAMKAELDSLRSQLQHVTSKAEAKEHDIANRVADRVGREFDHYRRVAEERGAQLRDLGEARLDEVATHIRRNPLASLGIAFVAGWVLSSIWRGLR